MEASARGSGIGADIVIEISPLARA